MKVDTSKGHVDLSLKQVNDHQRREKIQEWKNEQKAENLLKIIVLGEASGTKPKGEGELSEEEMEAIKSEEDRRMNEFYEEDGHRLMEKFGSLYSAFEEASLDENALKDEGFTGKWTKDFIQVAKDNIVPPEVNIDAYMEVTCPLPDGVDHIREALLTAQMTDEVDIKVQYIGAPRYRLVVRAPDYKLAEEELQMASERVIEYIEAREGKAKYQRKE
jgi:translation initiation factor 2 subunit 1